MENIELLKRLYLTSSPSHKEDELSKIIQDELTKLNIPFNLHKLQIYSIREDNPLLCAHMDQASSDKITEVVVHRNCIFGDGNLGADDKNGVWIILQLLKQFPNLSFIFSTGEESGFDIDEVFNLFTKEQLALIPYGLVFDRRNGGDIIGVRNDYCNDDFQTDIARIGFDWGYTPSIGTISDCDIISTNKIPCVNISCGYYNPHSSNEFTDLRELSKALNFGRSIISNLNKTYSRVESSHGYEHSKYCYGFGYNYHDYWHGYDNYRNKKDTVVELYKRETETKNNWDKQYLEFVDWGCVYNTTTTNCLDCTLVDCNNCNNAVTCPTCGSDIPKNGNCLICGSLENEPYSRDTCTECGAYTNMNLVVDNYGNAILVCPICGTTFPYGYEDEKPKQDEIDYFGYCHICGKIEGFVNGICTTCKTYF